MSWNNVIPWEILECDQLCKRLDHGGYVIHEQDCPIGKKLIEDERTEDFEQPATRQDKLGKG